MRKHVMRRRPFKMIGFGGEEIWSMSVRQLRADYVRRRVAETVVRDGKAKIRISTVRLHSLRDYGAEIDTLAALAGVDVCDEWQTMVFGGPLDGFEDRSLTAEAARITHEVISGAVKHGAQRRAARRARLQRMHAAYHARHA